MLATAAGVLIAGPGASSAAPTPSGSPSSSSPTPPPNPTDGQISDAAQEKASLATEVGVLSGQIADAQTQVQQLQGEQELAEQKVALAVSKLQKARDAAARAHDAERAAADRITAAHKRFIEYLQASYTSGNVDGTGGALLTAQDPSALLAQTSLAGYTAQHKVDAVGAMQRATVAKANAEARAKRTVHALHKATTQARRAENRAEDAVAAEQAAKATLLSTQQTRQTQLDSAQLQLATLNHERAQYIAYQKEQARLAAIRAARLRAERIARARAAEKARQERIAEAAAERRREKHEREQRQQERQQERQHSGGGNGGGSSDSGSGSSSSHHPHHSHHSSGHSESGLSDGHWTAAKGREAVHRAMTQLGVPYSWAGGSASGKSYGVCASGDAYNDCNVNGFDCSGLVLYAWSAYWDHYAAHQYFQAGDKHPGLDHLKPGDLLFWSNGGASSIHHVAIYKGHGKIIQAPYSGAYLEVASMYEPGNPYGATRPLT